MKQLKFMLAAATAIGLATVVQADDSDFGSTDFESSLLVVDGIFPSLPDGAADDSQEAKDFALWEVPTDNFSTLVDSTDFGGKTSPKKYAQGTHTKALNVDVGEGTLVRRIENEGEGASLQTGTVYIDTMVQFTVTPDEAEPTPGGEDKLMLFAKNGDDDKAYLHVVAGSLGLDEGDMLTIATSVVDTGVEVEPNTWYRLTVMAEVRNADNNGNTVNFSCFKIWLDGIPVPTGSSALWYEDLDKVLFPSIKALSETAGIEAVGFSGEGKVDDLVFTTEYPFEASTVDFTLALGEGVSAVSWTVNGETQATEGGKFTAASDVSSLNVAISSVVYDSGYAGTQDWTTYTYNDTKSGSVEITAKKFADVSAGGVMTPTDETVSVVDAGSFKVPEATDDNTEVVAAAKADLAKALTWATSKGGKSYNDAISTIKNMDFTDTTETTSEQAYLLNCAPTTEAIDEKKGAFVFSAFTVDANGDTEVTVDPEFASDVNGKIEIRGAISLDDDNAFKAIKKPGDAFFRAFLVK